MQRNIEIEGETYHIQTYDNKKFIIGYVIFASILVILTAILIVITIKNLNTPKEVAYEEIEEVDPNTKKATDETKYLIKSYSETYDMNSLEIKKYVEINGNVISESEYIKDVSKYRSDNYKNYIEINGLKNKEIQNNINNIIKEKVNSIRGKNIYTYVTANFSNILSVIINGDNQIETLNINLATGKEIKLEKLFMKTTNLNSYLAEGLYKELAWSTLKVDENGEEQNDMSKVDTSEYEDKFLMIIKNYNKNKDNLKYNISANQINIYGLIDKKIIDDEHASERSITIDLLDCMDQVTMYKRFLKNESIYEDDNVGQKGIIAFTNSTDNFNYMETLNYGKIQSNIFMEEVLMNNIDDEEKEKIPREYIKKLLDEKKGNLINENIKNKGTFYQREFSIWYDKEKQYYQISETSSLVQCSISYFRTEAFLDYIKLKAKPTASAELLIFANWINDFPNLEMISKENKEYFLGEDGEYWGDSREKLEAKLEEIRLKKEQEEAQNRIVEEIENAYETINQEEIEQENERHQQNNLRNTTGNESTDTNTSSNNTSIDRGRNVVIYNNEI